MSAFIDHDPIRFFFQSYIFILALLNSSSLKAASSLVRVKQDVKPSVLLMTKIYSSMIDRHLISQTVMRRWERTC